MTSQKRNKSNNQRVKERRNKRKLVILDKRLEDKLYQESRIDPNTVEGQSTLDISRICDYDDDLGKIENKESDKDTINSGYIRYLLSYIWR